MTSLTYLLREFAHSWFSQGEHHLRHLASICCMLARLGTWLMKTTKFSPVQTNLFTNFMNQTCNLSLSGTSHRATQLMGQTVSKSCRNKFFSTQGSATQSRLLSPVHGLESVQSSTSCPHPLHIGPCLSWTQIRKDALCIYPRCFYDTVPWKQLPKNTCTFWGPD